MTWLHPLGQQPVVYWDLARYTCILLFFFPGTPLAILNRGITVGTISNVHADCNAPATSSFNPSSGIMQVVYQISRFYSNPNCTVTTDPSLFGYRRNSDTFAIGFDVRSVFTCVAVNSRIIKPNYLQITAQSTYIYRNTSYFIAAYVDPRYPGMKPIQCLFPDSSGTPVCLLIIGSVYVLPVFNHGGYSFDMPVPCNCTGSEDFMFDVHNNPYNLCKWQCTIPFYALFHIHAPPTCVHKCTCVYILIP